MRRSSVSDVRGGTGADPEKPRANQEFMLVTNSLGSYLTFSALDDIDLTEKTAAAEYETAAPQQRIAVNNHEVLRLMAWLPKKHSAE